MSEEFQAMLDSGATQLCHCWRICRADGVMLGFTDHDLVLEFDGTRFEAASGMTGSAHQSTSGMSADNTSVIGALQSDGISEAHLRSGFFDDAVLEVWRVHWPDPDIRVLEFRGTVGEIQIANGSYTAEIRSIVDRLDRPLGRVLQQGCTAILGDKACGVDLMAPGNSAILTVETVSEGRVISFAGTGGIAAGDLERGFMTVNTGRSKGLRGTIKRHRIVGGDTVIELWESMHLAPEPGDTVQCHVGCDKSLSTCRGRFGNLPNFRGFPHIPGDDWLMSVPKSSGANTGGSLKR